MKRFLLALCCLTILALLAPTASQPAEAGLPGLPDIQLIAADPNRTKLVEANLRESYEFVLNKYKVAFYFWYDTFANGEIPAENVAKAGALLNEAERLIADGARKSDIADLKKALGLMNEADRLLNVNVKSPDQFPYETSTPLLNPDLRKVHKAKVADHTVLDRYGVLMNDIGPSIWGYADDGEFYLITNFFNYHATGKIIVPVVVEVMSTKDPNARYVYLLNKESKVTRTDNSIEYYVEDGAKKFRVLVTDDPVGGGTTVYTEGSFPAVSGKAPAISFKVTSTPAFSYWYNQNVGAANMYPDIVLAGFEQPGPASGTITVDGAEKKFTTNVGQVMEICMISGAPGKAYKEYRTNMSKYGNEWYIPFHTGQLDGIFISYGKFRDSALYYKGQYIVPTEFILVPGIANQTLKIVAKTKEYGDLVLNFEIKLHDPVYTERVATVTGTFDGLPLTNGGAWFEHVFKGSPDGIKAVQEYPQIVDPM